MERLILNTMYPSASDSQSQSKRLCAQATASDFPPTPGTRLKSTIISIDSRDRDKQKHPKASQFSIDLGKTFKNVYSIDLRSLEFPISDNIIKSTPKSVQNNILPWCNYEDYNLSIPYAPYLAQVRPGMYSALTLNSELTTQCNSIKRQQGLGTNHLWTINIDLDTNIVNFASYKTSELGTDPLTFTEGSSTIQVTHEKHGLHTDDMVTIYNCPPIFGLFQDTFDTALAIKVIDENTYTVRINQEPIESGVGGGKNIIIAVAAKFKLLWADIPNSLHYILGFPLENSSDPVNLPDPISTVAYTISNYQKPTNDTVELFLKESHILRSGENVLIDGIGVTTIENTTLTSITIPSESNINYTGKIVGTDYYMLSFPDHGFQSITSIVYSHENTFVVTTASPHNYKQSDSVSLKNTDSVPSLNGVHLVTEVLSDTMFTISVPSISGFSQSATRGIIIYDDKFQLYRCHGFDGLAADALNGKNFTVNRVLDKNTIIFRIPTKYSSTVGLSGGGPDVRMSSALHGWSFVHSNTVDRDNVFRPIKLDGENYCFLCSPELENMMNSGPTKNIFAKILLTESPGSTVFNTFVPQSKIFSESLLKNLTCFSFEVRTPSNTFYEFNDMDFSFTLEIKEAIADNQLSLQSPILPPSQVQEIISNRTGNKNVDRPKRIYRNK